MAFNPQQFMNQPGPTLQPMAGAGAYGVGWGGPGARDPYGTQGQWGNPVVPFDEPITGLRPGGQGGIYAGGMGGGGFGGFLGGPAGGGGGGGNARAAAEAERRKALGLLEIPGLQGFLGGAIAGRNVPYSQGVQDRMFSGRADQIGAGQDAARQRAVQRAASMGLGRGAGLASQMSSIEAAGSGQRQGALRDIQHQAAMGNYAAQRWAAGQSVPMASQAAGMRFGTQFRGGAGGGGRGGSNPFAFNNRLEGASYANMMGGAAGVDARGPTYGSSGFRQSAASRANQLNTQRFRGERAAALRQRQQLSLGRR